MLPSESAPMTDVYHMTTSQDFETTVLTSPFREGCGKQLVSPRINSDHLFGQGERVKSWEAQHTEVASGEGTRHWLEEMRPEAETS